MSQNEKEYERIRGLINQWNDDHYDIFELSQPTEDLEFHGVVRFFFQGAAGANVITKCIRVASSATTREVIDVLIEKFRPDMRMLGQSKYALYEVHVNGEERRLEDQEPPLYVQLEWGNDVREGRFLLRNEDVPTVRDPALGFDKSVLERDQPGFKRKLSKREKKEKKRREREKENEPGAGAGEDGVASKLYSEAPETSFTRSISNPEAVMRRRRQQKLEKKLAEMNSAEGGSDSGGTLKIHGESICPGVPYKTLFLSTADPAMSVVQEAMEKYGLEKEDPFSYCLVEVLLPPGGMEYHGGQVGDERILDDDECPLAIVMQHTKQSRNQGHIIFQIRLRSSDSKKRPKRPRAVSQEDLRNHQSDQRHTNVNMLPYLIEINVRGKPKQHVLPLNVTEVVNVTEVANNRSDYNGKHFLQLSGSDIKPRHCVIAHTDGIVTMTPNSQDAETYVERQQIYQTTMLKHGMTVQFGKDKLYRFLDPRFEMQGARQQRGPPQETTFDVDGQVDSGPKQQQQQQLQGPPGPSGPPGWEAQQRRSGSDRSPGSYTGSQGMEDLLPASLEFNPEVEDRLLQGSILEVNSKQLQFKLAPTYTLYMAVRNLMALRSPPAHKAQMIADFVSKTSKMTQQCIQEHHNDPPSLAFWMANSSEILHMFKQDRDVQPVSADCQEMLAEAVQMAFHHLVRCLQNDLQRVMPAFLDPAEDDNDEEMGQRYNMGRPTLADVLNTLSAAMTLLRRCRVNAALTIQLFSQLFHFINMWLFNILVTEPQLQLCTRQWGLRLKQRLGSVEAWAEKQGLELAADCHLCRIIQAAHLLQAPKSTADDITNISSTCFKLNSMQLQALLARYIPEPHEPSVSGQFIERVVAIAENMADELTKTDGREVRLEEDPDLHLPFLLPEDGYSCDTSKGVPNGLPEFVRQLESAGLCRFSVNNNASGVWTVYMGDGPPLPHEGGNQSPGGMSSSPEVINVAFNKVKGSMGLSIVAATGEGQNEQGIYVKSVVEGGAAALDGRLQTGDQLLEVDGKSLVGLSQDKAAELMTRTGQVVNLCVAKQGAFFHNLGTLLSQPSPTSQRAALNRGGAGGPHGGSEEGPPPPYNGNKAPPYGQEPKEPYHRRDIESKSKSTSNLHVETTFDRSDVPATSTQMKPAQSVGVLHPANAGSGYGQYSPGGRPLQDPRVVGRPPNDYENHPSQYPGDRGSYDGPPRQPGYNFVDPRQNLPKTSAANATNNQVGYLQAGMPQRASDRSSVSSRASSNSNKDSMRPQSAYYDSQGGQPQGLPNGNGRPRSEDMSRVGKQPADWQDPNRSSMRRNNNTNDGGQSPPYSNIGAHNQPPPPTQQQQQQQYNNNTRPPTAHERLFNSTNNQQQRSVPPQHQNQERINVHAHSRQPNFYENTMPLQHDAPPAFHQLHRPPSDAEMARPTVKPKPPVSAKRNQPRITPADTPMMKVDNRLTQPHFYGHEQPPPPPQQQQQQHPYHHQQQPPPPEQQGYDPRSLPPHEAGGYPGQQRPPPAGLRNGPASPDYRNIGEQQQRNGYADLRNGPDLRNIPDPRNGPDLRNIPDPRNGPDYRTMPDPRNGPDLRNAPDPRNGPPDNTRSGPNNYSMPHQQPARVTQDQDPRYHHPHQQHPNDPQGMFVGGGGYPEELPPPPAHTDFSPELPPPPHVEDPQEDLPPLPPPPPSGQQDPMMAQRLVEEQQQKLMQQINMTNQYLSTGRNKNYSPTGMGSQPGQPQQLQQQQQPRTNSRPPQQEQQFGVDNRDVPMSYQMEPSDQRDNHHNYQNIGFAQEVRAASGPQSQVPPPPVPQPPSEYESYHNPALQMQGFEMHMPKGPVAAKLNEPVAKSAWDRDAREKAEEKEQEELFKAREREINEMEARPYLSPPDQDRLRKLKMEHEFQRRVREIAEKGDYDVDEDDELAERMFSRDRQIQTLREDLGKSRKRLEDLDDLQQRAEVGRERDRQQMMERRLEMLENDKKEQMERMSRKEEKRAQKYQESVRQQRESREKQRQNYEEQKRQLMKEEEKLNQRREEEMNKKRQFEKERRQELQDKRDAEEQRRRAEIRREENEYAQQQLMLEKQQRLDKQRPVRVGEERRRLESKSQELSSPTGYAHYANINSGAGDVNNPPPTSSVSAPAPPERKASSFETYTQHQQRALANTNGPQRPNALGGLPSQQQEFPPPPPPTSNHDPMGGGRYGQLPPSALKNSQEPPVPAKKSVSFNTQMNTYKDRTPSHSISSYKSPTESQPPDLGMMPPPPVTFSPTDDNNGGDVFDPDSDALPPPPLPPPPSHMPMPYNNSPGSPTTNNVVYSTSSNTPNVIGAQEVYRDPRSRIEAAKMASQTDQRPPASDRMSFREKMKYFALEAGEEAIKVKPKTSRTLRDIESQLHGGSG